MKFSRTLARRRRLSPEMCQHWHNQIMARPRRSCGTRGRPTVVSFIRSFLVIAATAATPRLSPQRSTAAEVRKLWTFHTYDHMWIGRDQQIDCIARYFWFQDGYKLFAPTKPLLLSSLISKYYCHGPNICCVSMVWIYHLTCVQSASCQLRRKRRIKAVRAPQLLPSQQPAPPSPPPRPRRRRPPGGRGDSRRRVRVISLLWW